MFDEHFQIQDRVLGCATLGLNEHVQSLCKACATYVQRCGPIPSSQNFPAEKHPPKRNQSWPPRRTCRDCGARGHQKKGKGAKGEIERARQRERERTKRKTRTWKSAKGLHFDSVAAWDTLTRRPDRPGSRCVPDAASITFRELSSLLPHVDVQICADMHSAGRSTLHFTLTEG